MIAVLRSVLHMAFMFVTIIPFATLIVVASLLGVKGDTLYRWAAQWLRLSIEAARVIFAGLARGDFWISTHPEVTRAMLAGRTAFFQSEAAPTLTAETEAILNG